MNDIIIEAVSEPVFMDLCLRFVDEAQAFDHLNIPQTKTTTTYTEDGIPSTTTVTVEGEYAPRYTAMVDVIGTIYKPTGQFIAEDPSIPEMIAVDGYHVNLRGVFLPENVEALQTFIVTPQMPVRVWA